ncbi:MAG: hypothetical protein AAFQ63_18745, partial [Cyanobacteria bacterium J06621_11]
MTTSFFYEDNGQITRVEADRFVQNVAGSETGIPNPPVGSGAYFDGRPFGGLNVVGVASGSSTGRLLRLTK